MTVEPAVDVSVALRVPPDSPLGLGFRPAEGILLFPHLTSAARRAIIIRYSTLEEYYGYPRQDPRQDPRQE